MHLIARSSGYHTLNFIATDLQLYKIFKIIQVSFFWDTVYNYTLCSRCRITSVQQQTEWK